MSDLELFNSLQFVPTEELKSFQEKELKKLLLHCHSHVPYYKAIFEKTALVRNEKVDYYYSRAGRKKRGCLYRY